MTKRRAVVALLAALAVGSRLASGEGEAPTGPTVDAFGDPLPAGARARAGTVRLRHERGVISAAFSPDGKTIASVSQDGELRLFEAATGKELRRSKKAQGAFLAVLFAHDGGSLVLGTDGGVAALPVADGAPRFDETGHSVWTCALAVSPDGKSIATAGRSQKGGHGAGAVRLFSGSTGKMLREETEDAASCAFSPDSRTLAVGLDAEAVSLRDARSGKETARIEAEAGEGFASALAFSKDGKTLAVWGRGRGAVRFLDVASKKEKKKVEIKAAAGMERAVFSPDVKTVAFAKDRFVLADLSSGKTILTGGETAGPDGAVSALAFSQDGKRLLLGRSSLESGGGGSARVQVFDAATGAELPSLLGSRDPVLGLAFSPDGAALALARQDELSVHDALLGTAKRRHEGRGLARLAFSQDGKALVAAGEDEALVFEDEKSAKPTRRVAAPSGSKVVALSPSGSVFLAESEKLELALVDVASGKEARRLEASSFERGSYFAFSADGARLACACSKKPLRVFEVASGKTTREVPNDLPVRGLAFSSDGKTIALAVEPPKELVLRLLDAESGSVKRELKANPGIGVGALAFSPSAFAGPSALAGPRTALLAHASGTPWYRPTQLWDVEQGVLRTSVQGQVDVVVSLAFSPDSKLLACGSLDGTALVFGIGR